ncbi:prophage CP4-57 integrase, partial [Yersinia pestis PY-47]
MARTTRPLTHTEVQKAKTTDKDLTLHDGDGLFLLVVTNGAIVIHTQRLKSDPGGNL